MTTDHIDLAKLKMRWRGLDDAIRAGWDADMRTALERDICENGPDWTWTETISKISGRKPEPKSNSETLLFLPFPFRPGAGRGAFPEMFAWDSYFVNLGLLAHGRYDLVRGALLNQLFMIMRHGKVLNGNRTYLSGRSQPPLHADAIWRYYKATGDRDMLLLSYPLLCREYREYWLDRDHSTPTKLTTHNDATDPNLRPQLNGKQRPRSSNQLRHGRPSRPKDQAATDRQSDRRFAKLCVPQRLGTFAATAPRAVPASPPRPCQP